ncbi:hypothetical protein B0H19DRAFT_1251580 [Mycena capillaripes]|nr:hypothetical protein B0H19DRAFT_1251580 [Mycena capillaripes]
MFQGRDPPSAGLSLSPRVPPPVVPTPTSQLLPTHSDALDNPNKTLVSVSLTGVMGNIPTDICQEKCAQVARYCARYFASHVLLTPLGIVLTRLGTPALVDKLAELKKVARTQLDATLKDAVLENFDKESLSSSKPRDREIDGRYWLCRLADVCHYSSYRVDYFPTAAEPLPEDEQHCYKRARKYDVSLRPSAVEGSTIRNIFVNIEFTKCNPPSMSSNPLIGASDHVAKYQQAITNPNDLLTFQPTRLFVPTLSFHGKGEETKLFVSILSQERLEFAIVDNCFDSDSLPTVSALLHLFRIASIYQLGFNPLLTYNFSPPPPPPPPNFTDGDAVPSSVVLPGAQGIVYLSGKRLSRVCSTPFQCLTVVLEGELREDSQLNKDPTPVVVKMSFIAEARLLTVFAARGSPPPGLPNSEVLQSRQQERGVSQSKKREREALPSMVPRHLEIMVFASPRGARKLKDVPSATEFLTAAQQLFEAIFDAFCRRILHRDISVNNVLVANNQLPSSPAGRHTITGTLDTMAVASLDNADPLPHDDIESAVYVLLKVLTQTYVPSVDQQDEWAELLKTFHWDDAGVEVTTLSQLWRTLWLSLDSEGLKIDLTLEMIRSPIPLMPSLSIQSSPSLFPPSVVHLTPLTI